MLLSVGLGCVVTCRKRTNIPLQACLIFQDNQRVTTLKEDKYKQANKTALQTKGNTVEKWSDTQKKDRTKLRA